MSVPPVKETIEQYGLESQPRMSFSTTSTGHKDTRMLMRYTHFPSGGQDLVQAGHNGIDLCPGDHQRWQQPNHR